MLNVVLIKYHEYGNLKMTIKAPRNPVLDYMVQANHMVKDYLANGWHIVTAYID